MDADCNFNWILLHLQIASLIVTKNAPVKCQKTALGKWNGQQEVRFFVVVAFFSCSKGHIYASYCSICISLNWYIQKRGSEISVVRDLPAKDVTWCNVWVRFLSFHSRGQMNGSCVAFTILLLVLSWGKKPESYMCMYYNSSELQWINWKHWTRTRTRQSKWKWHFCNWWHADWNWWWCTRRWWLLCFAQTSTQVYM